MSDPKAIRAVIAEGRARGFVICNQLHEVGVPSVAAAILNPRDAPAGAIALAVPTARADADKIAAMGAQVAEAAVDISTRLFGRAPSRQR
ncbi:MAG: IclR family transcriptional regulator C-terminal domain-containing protein [Cypionkella sp.]